MSGLAGPPMDPGSSAGALSVIVNGRPFSWTLITCLLRAPFGNPCLIHPAELLTYFDLSTLTAFCRDCNPAPSNHLPMRGYFRVCRFYNEYGWAIVASDYVGIFPDALDVCPVVYGIEEFLFIQRVPQPAIPNAVNPIVGRCHSCSAPFLDKNRGKNDVGGKRFCSLMCKYIPVVPIYRHDTHFYPPPIHGPPPATSSATLEPYLGRTNAAAAVKASSIAGLNRDSEQRPTSLKPIGPPLIVASEDQAQMMERSNGTVRPEAPHSASVRKFAAVGQPSRSGKYSARKQKSLRNVGLPPIAVPHAPVHNIQGLDRGAPPEASHGILVCNLTAVGQSKQHEIGTGMAMKDLESESRVARSPAERCVGPGSGSLNSAKATNPVLNVARTEGLPETIPAREKAEARCPSSEGFDEEILFRDQSLSGVPQLEKLVVTNAARKSKASNSPMAKPQSRDLSPLKCSFGETSTAEFAKEQPEEAWGRLEFGREQSRQGHIPSCREGHSLGPRGPAIIEQSPQNGLLPDPVARDSMVKEDVAHGLAALSPVGSGNGEDQITQGHSVVADVAHGLMAFGEVAVSDAANGQMMPVENDSAEVAEGLLVLGRAAQEEFFRNETVKGSEGHAKEAPVSTVLGQASLEVGKSQVAPVDGVDFTRLRDEFGKREAQKSLPATHEGAQRDLAIPRPFQRPLPQGQAGSGPMASVDWTNGPSSGRQALLTTVAGELAVSHLLQPTTHPTSSFIVQSGSYPEAGAVQSNGTSDFGSDFCRRMGFGNERACGVSGSQTPGNEPDEVHPQRGPPAFGFSNVRNAPGRASGGATFSPHTPSFNPDRQPVCGRNSGQFVQSVVSNMFSLHSVEEGAPGRGDSCANEVPSKVKTGEPDGPSIGVIRGGNVTSKGSSEVAGASFEISRARIEMMGVDDDVAVKVEEVTEATRKVGRKVNRAADRAGGNVTYGVDLKVSNRHRNPTRIKKPTSTQKRKKLGKSKSLHGGLDNGKTVCEVCRKEHNGSFGAGRFCGLPCSKKSMVEHRKADYTALNAIDNRNNKPRNAQVGLLVGTDKAGSRIATNQFMRSGQLNPPLPSSGSVFQQTNDALRSSESSAGYDATLVSSLHEGVQYIPRDRSSAKSKLKGENPARLQETGISPPNDFSWRQGPCAVFTPKKQGQSAEVSPRGEEISESGIMPNCLAAVNEFNIPDIDSTLKLCGFCQEPHDGSYETGRFCCYSCAKKVRPGNGKKASGVRLSYAGERPKRQAVFNGSTLTPHRVEMPPAYPLEPRHVERQRPFSSPKSLIETPQARPRASSGAIIPKSTRQSKSGFLPKPSNETAKDIAAEVTQHPTRTFPSKRPQDAVVGISPASKRAKQQNLSDCAPSLKDAQPVSPDVFPASKHSKISSTSNDINRAALIKCGLCRCFQSPNKAVVHPVLAQQPLRMCMKCGEVVLNRLLAFSNLNALGIENSSAVKLSRVEEEDIFCEDEENDCSPPTVVVHGDKGWSKPVSGCEKSQDKTQRKSCEGLVRSRATLEAQRFLYVVEEFMYRAPSSLLIDKGLSLEFVQRLKSPNCDILTHDLDISTDALSILHAVYSHLGLSLEKGKLSWPVDGIPVPSAEAVTHLIETALPRSASDRAKHQSGGERVWNEVFPNVPWSKESLSSREIFSLLLGLIGITLAPPRRTSGRHGEILHLDPISVSMAMHNASDRAVDLDFQALFDSPQLVVPRAITRARQYAMDSKIVNDPVSFDVCCCCGSMRSGNEFPFTFFSCDACPKRFCSICLGLVFGVQEFHRAVLPSFQCQSCRLTQKVEALTTTPGVSATNSAGGSKLRRRGKCDMGKDLQNPIIPLVIIAPQLAAICLGVGKRNAQAENAKSAIMFALHCEQINLQCLALTSQSVNFQPASASICAKCKNHVTGFPGSAAEEGSADAPNKLAKAGLTCSFERCNTIMHISCCRDGTTVSESSWHCPYHVCADCEGSISPRNLVRCRTCPISFCKEHLPVGKKIHIYGAGWISCPDCSPRLEHPKLYPRQLREIAAKSDKTVLTAIETHLLKEFEHRARRQKSFGAFLRRLAEDRKTGPSEFTQILRRKKISNRGMSRTKRVREE